MQRLRSTLRLREPGSFTLLRTLASANARSVGGWWSNAVGSRRSLSSGFPESQKIWRDGTLIPWHEANVHILSTAVQFGNSLFEGVRCYSTPSGPAIVHLHGHMRRLIEVVVPLVEPSNPKETVPSIYGPYTDP